MINKQEIFKSYLRKIGSGTNTSHGMSRHEAADALKLMLRGEASPAQIGAFLIAHRIRRPEAQEIAGMLDTYLELGPKLTSVSNQRRPICLGMPFDGRTKTCPIYPLTALVLLSAGQPVTLQGGKRMPVKYGVSSTELFKEIGLRLDGLSMKDVQNGFNKFGFALIHQPDHFPLADTLITYRDEIGKRPTLSSMELIWTVHQGEHIIVSGFFHLPTELNSWKALEMRGEKDLITIKGLEGGIDLPISRKCITGKINTNGLQRTTLNPHENECFGEDIQWESLEVWGKYAYEAIDNKGVLSKALNWNSGFYLWKSDLAKNLEEGIDKAKYLLNSGTVKKVLDSLIEWRLNL